MHQKFTATDGFFGLVTPTTKGRFKWIDQVRVEVDLFFWGGGMQFVTIQI